MEGTTRANRSDGEATFARRRALQENRAQHEWQHAAGLPPFCKKVPLVEGASVFNDLRQTTDIAGTIASAGISALTWAWDKKGANELRHYEKVTGFRGRPAVADRWQLDEEFARQRLDGTNPVQIQRCDVVPRHFAVSQERVASLVGSHKLSALADAGRLYLCDWSDLEGVPTVLGRFLTAPMALFWVDDRGTLMPLAIQLGQSVDDAPVVFTPHDEPWLWLTARTHVQAADAAYHEVVVHLLRTHFVMETVWVATSRALPPQHPVHEFLAPHFAGTIDVNHKARTKMLAPGGPIDSSISVGTDGAYWLIDKVFAEFSFEDLHPLEDFERRGVDDAELLQRYHYRDDAARLWGVIDGFVEEMLTHFYDDDESVAADDELAAWVRELSSSDAGGLRGLPVTDGRFVTIEALRRMVTQVIFTASCEHSAVNNGQYDIFGFIPNAPGAMYLPPPTTSAPSCEGEFVYALPPMKAVDMQLTLVHLLSMPVDHRLGDYPADFFLTEQRVHAAIDRFCKNLDRVAIDIEQRNATLAVPYTYLDPVQIAPSISV